MDRIDARRRRRDSARWTTAKIEAIRTLENRARDYIRTQRPKTYTRELVELIFTQPYCRIQNVVEAGIGQRQAAARHLRALVEIGVLQEQRVGKEVLFMHPAYLRLLSAETHEVPDYGVQPLTMLGTTAAKSREAGVDSKAPCY